MILIILFVVLFILSVLLSDNNDPNYVEDSIQQNDLINLMKGYKKNGL